MNKLKVVTVFLFLAVVFPVTPSSAVAAGSASSSGNITPMQFAPPNITPMNLSRPNITPPNIIPAQRAHSAGFVHVGNFQDNNAALQAQQKAWEAKMRDRQRQLDLARADAEAIEAAQITPAAGEPAPKPAPYKPSIFLIGFVKFVNLFAPSQNNDKAVSAP